MAEVRARSEKAKAASMVNRSRRGRVFLESLRDTNFCIRILDIYCDMDYINKYAIFGKRRSRICADVRKSGV